MEVIAKPTVSNGFSWPQLNVSRDKLTMWHGACDADRHENPTSTCADRQFYQSAGKWTANPAKAHNFKAIEAALNIAHGTTCPNLEVQLSFQSPHEQGSFKLAKLFATV
jgi:hypothetical protein